MAGRRSGRLELTWTNKEMRLLAHGSDTYEWVDPHDWRVSEVRLLHEVDTVGAPSDNLLIQGDALHALTALSSLPELAPSFVGQVKLCYIDPPFNTGQTFAHYDDAVEHSVWLTMLRDRLVQIRKLLRPDGSVWVHLDDAEQHRGRCVLDEVFGAENFVATIVWQKRYSRENRPAIGAVHDFVHVYAVDAERFKGSRNRLPRSRAKEYRNPNQDPRGDWRAVPMTAQGYRANQMYEIVAPGGRVHRPPKGRCWSVIRERFDELLAQDRIYFGKDGNAQPGIIRYLDEDEGLTPWTWWPHDEVGHTDEAKKEMLALTPHSEAFSTPKPERLVQRIIHIASDPGDLVLDCFAGSGTTAAVAHKMGRRWVTVELSEDNVSRFVRPRLEKVVKGEDPGGVTETAGWTGGGGFRAVEVGPSMFEELDGRFVLAGWATNGALADAVCAQLGYTRDPDGPYAGRKGRSRLAVIDGMLTGPVAEHLIFGLGDADTLVVVAHALEPGVEELVRRLRRGSRARKVPRDLARRGVLPSRLVRLTAPKASM